jgi:hypothetical protein
MDKVGPQNGPTRLGTFGQANTKTYAATNDGAIAMMLAAMFLLGMTLGGVLPAHKTEPIQIASMY